MLTAEGVFAFIIEEINQQNSEFAKNLKSSFVLIIERRNINLLAFMQYLNFGRKYDAGATLVKIFHIFQIKTL